MKPSTIPILANDEHGKPHDIIDASRELFGQYGSYVADDGLINAANTALGLELPLLLTGEPGCGKSDFAWVAAKALGHEKPLSCYIRSDTRARDLLYHYDALGRFGDAQHGDPTRAKDPRNYVRLRPLGVALMTAAPRQVVLIDEIDKAPRDLPNDLLRELDEGHFEIAEIDAAHKDHRFDEEYLAIALRRQMQRPDARKPLIIITSNAERQLPEPFLRRCIFYHIPTPDEPRLLEIAKRRFPGRQGPLTTSLASVFFALRQHAEQSQLAKPPTTSEMIAWIKALTAVYDPADVQAKIAVFAEALALPQNGKKLPPGGPSWASLPGISVLIKLKEDLSALGHGRANPG